MAVKLGMKHQAMKLYKVCINHDPYAEYKMTLKEKTSRKWANGRNVYEFEKEINPKGYSNSVLGL